MAAGILAWVVLILALAHGGSTVVDRRPLNRRDALAFALAMAAIPLAMLTVATWAAG